MKRDTAWIAILGFILPSLLSGLTCTTPASDPYVYVPEDVTLKDNAYNVTPYMALQWWYLDAMFTNTYSMHIGILTIGARGTIGLFFFQIQLYKEGILQQQAIRISPLRRIQAADDHLSLTLSGDEFLRGYLVENKTLALDVILDLHALAVNLTFVGETTGWKGFTGLGMWGCPLPKAQVTGTITVQDEQMSVNGTGYQEHGWDVRRLHRSWYWGKFASAQTSVVFSQNMKNRWEEDVFIAVVNTDAKNYTGISRENIVFTPGDYEMNHGRRIPMTAVFQVEQENLSIDARIEVQTIDFKTLLLLNYWRFHVRVSGTITYGNGTENIDEYQIMEVYHFP